MIRPTGRTDRGPSLFPRERHAATGETAGRETCPRFLRHHTGPLEASKTVTSEVTAGRAFVPITGPAPAVTEAALASLGRLPDRLQPADAVPRGRAGGNRAEAPEDSDAVINACARATAHAQNRRWPDLRRMLADTVTVEYEGPFGTSGTTMSRDRLIASWWLARQRTTAEAYALSDPSAHVSRDHARCAATFRAEYESSDGTVTTLSGTLLFRLDRAPEGWRVTAAKARMDPVQRADEGATATCA